MEQEGHASETSLTYLGVFDQATWVFFSDLGITANYMRENRRGMAALVQHTEYKLEVFAGDVLEVQTAILAVTEKTMRFFHTMRRRPDGAVVATSELLGAHLDRDAHKSCPFPEEIRGRLLSRLDG